MKAVTKQFSIECYLLSYDDFLDHSKFKSWAELHCKDFNNHFKLDFDPFEIKLKDAIGGFIDLDPGDVINTRFYCRFEKIGADEFEQNYELIKE
jgi:hypothetical protein